MNLGVRDTVRISLDDIEQGLFLHAKVNHVPIGQFDRLAQKLTATRTARADFALHGHFRVSQTERTTSAALMRWAVRKYSI